MQDSIQHSTPTCQSVERSVSIPYYTPTEAEGLSGIYALTEMEWDGTACPGGGLQRVECEVKDANKVSKRPVYEKAFKADKGRKNLDASVWVGRDRLMAWIKEPGHIAGIVAYFFGLVVLDVDHPDGQAMVDRIIAIYGKPLAIVRTGSGGFHLLYPIDMAATPNAEAHLIWPGTKFYIDGEAVGETLGCERMAALWQPDVWLGAINDRIAIRDAGEDPSTLGVAFLDPDAIDRGPKHTKTERRENPLPIDPEEQQAILEAGIDALGLKPDGDGGWQGNCPCGEESRSETRFKAGMKAGKAVFHCFACENSNFDKAAWVGEMAAPYREAKDEANRARTAGVLSKSKVSPDDNDGEDRPDGMQVKYPVINLIRSLESKTHKMRNGQKVPSNKFTAWKYAKEVCDDKPVETMRIDWGDDTLHEGMSLIGYNARWNSLIEALQLKPTPSSEWVTIGGGEEGAGPLRVMRNEIRRRVATIVCDKPTKSGAEPTYRIAQIPANAWGANGKAIHGAITGLLGTHIERVNPLEGWVRAQIDSITDIVPDERTRLLTGLEEGLLGIPGLKPSTKHAVALARHVLTYYFTMLAHRLIQTLPEFSDRSIRVQREVPVLVGPGGIGKSTLMRMLIPDLPEGVGAVEIDLLDDPNVTARRVAGSVVARVDDMDSISGGKARIGWIKSFITKTSLTFHRKYEPDRTIPMPCVLIGTANHLDLPDDDAGTFRFVPLNLESDRSGDLAEVDDEEVARRMMQHIDDRVIDWFRAGLIRAVENAPLEMSKADRNHQTHAIGDSSRDLHGVLEVVKEMTLDPSYVSQSQMPAILACQVAHQKGWLKYPNDALAPIHRRADTILPSEDPGLETLKAAWHPKSGDGTWQIKLIHTAMRSVGWTHGAKLYFEVGEKRRRETAFTPIGLSTDWSDA